MGDGFLAYLNFGGVVTIWSKADDRKSKFLTN